MLMPSPLVFLIDVDNTLLDNDGFAADLSACLLRCFGNRGQQRYWALYAQRRLALGYADYLGTLQVFGDELDEDPRLLEVSRFLMEYPFAERLYLNAMPVVAYLTQLGMPVVLSDGDLIFQPHKIRSAGLWDALAGRVMISRHKEQQIATVLQRYPAEHYVMIEDKPQLLAAMKNLLGERLTTIFVRQGHYAAASTEQLIEPSPDWVITDIAELLHFKSSDFLGCSTSPAINGEAEHTLPVPVLSRTQQLCELGQRLWLDHISRKMLDDGTLSQLISQHSITGLTSNPTLFEQAIGGSDAYDQAIRQKAAAGSQGECLFLELALEDLRRAADLLRVHFDASDWLDGWVSMEISPLLAHDSAASIAAAEQIYAQADRPNLMVKIPGTPQSLAAIEQAIFAGIPVNVTLLFSCAHYLAAAEAYLRGLERRLEAGLDLQVASVASLFISRWDRAANPLLPAALQHRLGIGIGQRSYRAYRDLLASPRWQRLANAGARPQRLLWASTGSKDEHTRDTLYVEALAAPDTINTLPKNTLLAFEDHGQLQGVMARDGGDCVNIDALALQLQSEGQQAFVDSWQKLLRHITEKSTGLGAVQPLSEPMADHC